MNDEEVEYVETERMNSPMIVLLAFAVVITLASIVALIAIAEL